jgi:hypothetical protein
MLSAIATLNSESGALIGTKEFGGIIRDEREAVRIRTRRFHLSELTAHQVKLLLCTGRSTFESEFCGISAAFGSIGSLCRFFEGILHEDSLLPHVFSLLMHGRQLEARQDGERASEDDEQTVEPPLRRRALIVGSCFATWGVSCITSAIAFSRNRRRLSNYALAIGLAAAVVGTLFGVLTCFSWSWGWWL